jgi:hypothetical protein
MVGQSENRVAVTTGKGIGSDVANPMGRMDDCEENIGPVAVFLTSEGSGYVTRNTLIADSRSHINGSSCAPDLGE